MRHRIRAPVVGDGGRATGLRRESNREASEAAMNGVQRDSNMRGPYKALIAAMWLSPLYIAFRYWQVWNQLPARMVTHFGANGPPNGWMTPQESLTFSRVLSGMVLLLFAAILAYASRRIHALNINGRALMGFFYGMRAGISVIGDPVVRDNLPQ